MIVLIHQPFCPHSRFARLALSECQLPVELVEERPWERRWVYRFFGRGMLVVIANTLLDLPRQSLGLPFIPCL